MFLENINTQLIDWDSLPPEETKGKTGVNTARVFSCGDYKIRFSVYSANYESAGWCEKGHIMHCIEGKLTIKLKNGRVILLTGGNSLLLSENDHHIGITGNKPVKLFIID